MGLFKQLKQANDALAQAPELIRQATAMAAQAEELAATQRAALHHTAAAEAASAASMEVAGVSLDRYATICKRIAAAGPGCDAASIAAGLGIDEASWTAANDGFVAAMRTDPAVRAGFTQAYTAAV